MQHIYQLHNTIQAYAWGSTTAIPALMGVANPTGGPQAELWMGAHPKAPSMVKIDNQRVSLAALIETHPQTILGEAIAARFNNRLPYLFKVLAAAQPLSIQAHPNLEQAREGFARENQLAIPLNAPHRNYRDDNHKPECLCALEPFWALNGFRRLDEMLDLIAELHLTLMEKEIARIQSEPNSSGLKAFFHSLMTMPDDRKQAVLDQAIDRASSLSNPAPPFEWVIKLNRFYPGDIGALAPLFLNLILLRPGEAISLKSGELHAYLEGVGIELMANSDNVLRGGLTPKHIDTTELLRSLNFEARSARVNLPEKKDAFEWVYPTDVEEFRLSKMVIESSMGKVLVHSPSVEIILCTQGAVDITEMGDNHRLTIKKGMSAIIFASANQYRLEGKATLYKAAVP